MAKGERQKPKSDIEIARDATLLPIDAIGERIGIPAASLYRYGATKAKIATDFVEG